jgi:hypothetical protein
MARPKKSEMQFNGRRLKVKGPTEARPIEEHYSIAKVVKKPQL